MYYSSFSLRSIRSVHLFRLFSLNLWSIGLGGCSRVVLNQILYSDTDNLIHFCDRPKKRKNPSSVFRSTEHEHIDSHEFLLKLLYSVLLTKYLTKKFFEQNSHCQTIMFLVMKTKYWTYIIVYTKKRIMRLLSNKTIFNTFMRLLCNFNYFLLFN